MPITETPSTETAVAELQQTPPTPRAQVQMGIAPKTIDECWRMAQHFAQSEIVPKAYRGKPHDILVAIQFGMELSFPPMQALQSIAVINGRPTVWGDGLLALILASPLYLNHDEYYEVRGERRDGVIAADLQHDDTAAVCTFWRRGKAQPITRRFSVGQAKKAQLWSKEGPWQTYPDRQLAMRARGFAGRDAFADLLRGIRTAEEVRDIPPDADVIEAAPLPVPRRASATPSAPADASASPGPVRMTLRGLSVTNTVLVTPPAGESFFELTMHDTSGVARTFVTRETALYKEALSFEGTDHQVIVTCHDAPRADTQTRVLVLDTLGIDDAA